MIMYIITNYPSGFSLSGHVKGKKGCIVCLDNTLSVHLSGSQKLVYMRSQRFLPQSCRYRRTMKKYFDNTEEKEVTSRHLDAKLVFKMVKSIKVLFGKLPKPVQKRKKTYESDKQRKKDEPTFKK